MVSASNAHGFANLALAGKFDVFAPTGSREQLLREVLAPMLDQYLGGLAPTASRGRRTKSEKSRSG